MHKRRVADGLVQAGEELALPAGFSYKVLQMSGSAMSDGFLSPQIPDGMGVFPAANGTYKIVRNHELGEGNDIPAGTVIGTRTSRRTRRRPGERPR